ncbi:subtilase-type protease inhibitor [Streptomyces sp. TRM 70361]|uniref:subtilase-type protease inhibitor n=1 Tax=Streptomyces sp. TRM 70361 TaxID=3116553 RepID=UPI002E7B229F|nr:subtilase-type protease inhibitor [Streptomyces sp. TRM 70361]MEE1939934.1 subtilase-type protease inhibitor [Streptomyces sp. TRM 70361]
MRYAVKGLGLGAVVAAACLTGTAATATAAPAVPQAPQAPGAPSALLLTVGEGEDPGLATNQRAAVLNCSPNADGSHPAPGRACAELRAVEGDFETLVEPDPNRVCPMIWDPVVVTAQGIWDGREVSFTHTFANACVMEGATGAVFSF